MLTLMTLDAQTLAQPEDFISPQAEVEQVLGELAVAKRLPRDLRTRNVKEQFQFAFELIGGIPRLAHWANTHPSQFYALYSKLIPASVVGPNGGPVQIQLSWLNERDTRGQRSPTAVIDVQPTQE